MIAHLSGLLFEKSTQSIIISAGGVGYEVFVPLSTFYALPETNETVNLHIHTHVRDDALILFGFSSRLEKNIFLLLVSVSGIGPKLAANILSGMGPEDLLHAIAQGDAARLQAIPGIGKKTAERIALELKDKAEKITGEPQIKALPTGDQSNRQLMEDGESALMNLGYSAKASKAAVEKAMKKNSDMNLESLIKESLKALA